MTTIDGIPGRWRPWLPGVAQAPAEALAAAEGCTVPEAVAQAVLDAYAKIATDAATSSAGAVSTGQGTAASTPAPTNVLMPVLPTHPVAVDLADDGGVVCTTDAPGDRMHPAKWWAGSNACCDDHIPDGWVRPDEVITTTLPPACDTCGERSEHEVCS